MQARSFFHVQNSLGEGPLWVPAEQALYWVDFGKAHIWRWDYGEDKPELFPMPHPVSALGHCTSGEFIIATQGGLAFWQPGHAPHHLIPVPDLLRPGARLNDGAVDPAGRFWVGVLDEQAGDGALYRLDPDLSLHEMDRGFIISNGIGWNLAHTRMYFTDSERHSIFAYDYDLASGEIANRRVFISVEGAQGVPDGLTVDAEDCIWSVRCGGGMIERYDPQGKSMLHVALPVKAPTSCMFAGPQMDEMYITTAWSLVAEELRPFQPLGGNLFFLQPKVRGVPEPDFKGSSRLIG